MGNSGFEDNNGIRTITLVGSIGETTDFFRYPMARLTEIHIDMSATTYINSVGVKHWILWATKVPSAVKVFIQKCPFHIVNQASTVHGFLPKNFTIESFFAPFVCPECTEEFSIEIKNTENFVRATETTPAKINLPNPTCSKCPTHPALEPDFFPNKVFAFLKM